MGFIAVLLSLLLDQGLRHFEFLRGPRWFQAYFEGLHSYATTRNPWRAAAGALLIVLVPTIVTLFIGHLLDHMWSGLGLAFGVLVLLFTLGPQDLHAAVQTYMDAVRAGDEARAAALARAFTGAEPPADVAARNLAMTRRVLAEASDRLFGILFWFALLGPAGAALYRSSDFLRRLPDDGNRSPQFTAAAARLYGILAWIPAHLASFAYALAGSFEEAVTEMRGYYNTCRLHFFEVSGEVLVCAGLGALRSTAEEDGGIGQLRSALALVRRALIIWLVVYALITLFGWAW